MKYQQCVVGVYSYFDTLRESLEGLTRAGFKNLRVFSPMPHHDLEHFVEGPESPVRFFALFGAALGALCGLTLTILTALSWPLPVSAKPIAAVPPFMIIVFELTILFGSLLTLAGMLINSRLRRDVPWQLYDPRFSEDKFGVAVVCGDNEVGRVEEILRQGGAEEIKREGVRG